MKVVNHLIALSTVLIASVGIASSDAKSEMIDFASGTGMLIDKNHVLTASHVIDDADEILVEFSDSVSIKATVYRKNAEEDWAVLKLDAECAALPISCASEIQLGDKVYTLGFPSASLLGRDSRSRPPSSLAIQVARYLTKKDGLSESCCRALIHESFSSIPVVRYRKP